LARWTTTFEVLTHSQAGQLGQLFLDVVYGPVLAGAALTRARFHAINEPDGWRVFEIDYFTPPDAEDPWPSVRFR
jgi:hypothetical protein